MSSCTRNTPTKIILPYSDRQYFEAVALRTTASQRDAFRARIVLLAARGLNNTQVGDKVSCTRKTARKWRNRYAESGRDGLADKPRPGRPRIYDEATRAHITAFACELPADRGLPLSRFSSADIHDEAMRELDLCSVLGVCAQSRPALY